MGDTPQSNYQNTQKFNVQIQKMYKHYVTGSSTPDDNEQGEIIGIDDVRGEISVSVTGQTSTNLIKSLNISPTSTTPASTPNTATPVQFAQESRCHAFYRIIGFPVVNKDKTLFYNPGLDVIKIPGVTRAINLDKKIQIASNVDPKFEAISQAREAYSAGTAQIFSVPSSVEAGVLSLTSGTYGSKGSPNIRKFNAPYVNSTDPFDFSIGNQAYSNPGNIAATSTLSGNKEFLLSTFQDADGTPPNTAIGGYKILVQHEHIIKPFMVDPRIDFSIWSNKSKTVKGVSKRIAVPFVPDASYLMASSVSFADSPLIEKIITKRFSDFNNAVDGGSKTVQIQDFTQNLKTIQTKNIGTASLGEIFNSKVFQLSQQAEFAKYFSKIDSMMSALVVAMNVIHARQGNYYWLPIPSSSGPENGCAVRDVPVTKGFNIDLLTINDKDIIKNQLDSYFANLTSDTSQSNAIPDVAGTAKTNPTFTFDSDTSDSEGDTTEHTMDTLTKRRQKLLNNAADALQVVEMIMGEFSGLGLCDIVAVVGALNVVPKEILLGFLDDDAYERAKTVLGQALPGRPDSIQTTMNAFSETVSFFYQIMDKTFQDKFGKGGLTS